MWDEAHTFRTHFELKTSAVQASQEMRCNVRENDVPCNVLTRGSMVNTNVTDVTLHDALGNLAGAALPRNGNVWRDSDDVSVRENVGSSLTISTVGLSSVS